jgi:hypothetical protein
MYKNQEKFGEANEGVTVKKQKNHFRMYRIYLFTYFCATVV